MTGNNQYICVDQMSYNTSFSNPIYIKVLVSKNFIGEAAIHHRINNYTYPLYNQKVWDENSTMKKKFFKILLSAN